MRTKLTFLLLSFVVSFQSLIAEEPQIWEFTHAFQSSLNNIYTCGTDTIFVVGDIGLIAQSPNKGKNWNIQRFTYNLYDVLNDIYFVSNETGFVVGENGVILKTTNRGNNWTNCVSGTTKDLKAISGTGINNIWAVGEKGIVLNSKDEGQTWDSVSLSAQLPDFADIGFKNGYGYIVGNKGSIFKTTNGGENWTQQTNIEGFTGGESFKHLSITENKAFVNAGYSQVIYVNSNDSWQKFVLPGYSDFSDFTTYSSFFLNDNQGYLAGIEFMIPTGSSYGYGDIKIFRTDNGGTNWTIASAGSNNPISPESIIGGFNALLAFTDINTGYLITESRIYRIPFVGDIDAGFYDNIENHYEDKTTILYQHENILKIKNLNKRIADIKLISMSGQIIYQQRNNYENNEITIDINNFNNGVYIIQMNFKDNSFNWIKWIKP